MEILLPKFPRTYVFEPIITKIVMSDYDSDYITGKH